MSDVNISAVYDAINPMPAMLSAKGKVKPTAQLRIEANAGIHAVFSWVKDGQSQDWDREYEVFVGGTVTEAVTKALSFINDLPDASTARLHKFMGQLGKLIDDGRDVGIDVDYLNPLVETMKRLSKNAITHQPSNVVQIGNHDKEYLNTVDTVASIVGAPQFDGAA